MDPTSSETHWLRFSPWPIRHHRRSLHRLRRHQVVPRTRTDSGFTCLRWHRGRLRCGVYHGRAVSRSAHIPRAKRTRSNTQDSFGVGHTHEGGVASGSPTEWIVWYEVPSDEPYPAWEFDQEQRVQSRGFGVNATDAIMGSEKEAECLAGVTAFIFQRGFQSDINIE